MTQNCGGCKHWTPNGQGASGFGRCERVPVTERVGQAHQDELVVLKAYRNHERDTQLRTRGEFGCCQWEKKDD